MWALPVTGSSSMPKLGAKARDTKSNGCSGSAAAVTMTMSAGIRLIFSMSWAEVANRTLVGDECEQVIVAAAASPGHR